MQIDFGNARGPASAVVAASVITGLATIPAKTGIHRPTIPMPEKNTPSFPRRRESTPSVIPAKTGTGNIEDGLHCMDSRLRGNDVASGLMLKEPLIKS